MPTAAWVCDKDDDEEGEVKEGSLGEKKPQNKENKKPLR